MIPSYYEALHNHSFNHGVNFASAGAGCLDETYSGKVGKAKQLYFKNIECGVDLSYICLLQKVIFSFKTIGIEKKSNF